MAISTSSLGEQDGMKTKEETSQLYKTISSMVEEVSMMVSVFILPPWQSELSKSRIFLFQVKI